MRQTQISAKVIADSYWKPYANVKGREDERIRGTTMLLRNVRMTHADFMTHRVFGRNARSSRAVPNKVLLREPIVEPIRWGANQKGMMAGDELSGWRFLLARATWLGMAQMTRVGVRVLNFAGLHKQWSNRPLEWFGCIDVLVTSTDWANFFALREHEAAQPEIQFLATQMRTALANSEPTLLGPGQWHMPYVENKIWGDGSQTFYYKPENRDFMRGYDIIDLEDAKKLSVARCARMTFKPFDGSDDLESEFARYDRLMVSQPVHASPAEHQFTPDTGRNRAGRWEWDNPELHGNLRGAIQLRKTIPNEWVPG